MDFPHVSMLAGTFNPHTDSGTHIHTKEGAGPSVSGVVSVKTDALAGKHIAGMWRTTHRNRQSHLKGTVYQRVTAEAKVLLGHPKNRRNKQKGQLQCTTRKRHCSTCRTFDPFFRFRSRNVHFA